MHYLKLHCPINRQMTDFCSFRSLECECVWERKATCVILVTVYNSNSFGWGVQIFLCLPNLFCNSIIMESLSDWDLLYTVCGSTYRFQPTFLPFIKEEKFQSCHKVMLFVRIRLFKCRINTLDFIAITARVMKNKATVLQQNFSFPLLAITTQQKDKLVRRKCHFI